MGHIRNSREDQNCRIADATPGALLRWGIVIGMVAGMFLVLFATPAYAATQTINGDPVDVIIKDDDKFALYYGNWANKYQYYSVTVCNNILDNDIGPAGIDKIPAPTDTRVDTDLHHEVVFIDASVHDAETLFRCLNSDSEVYWVSTNGSGLSQIAGILSGMNNVDSIHILSHGSKGKLFLGTDILTTDNPTLRAQISLKIDGGSHTFTKFHPIFH